VPVGLLLVVDYRKHGRTFPNQRANAGPDQSYLDFRSSSGRCAPSHHPAEDHPQVLIIAPVLGLSPKGVRDEEPALRKVLQSLVALTQGVTEIRNQVGVDHGAEEVPRWVRARHARLVVGAAQVWCQLMLETCQ
jgi:Abortive infection C-terminus